MRATSTVSRAFFAANLIAALFSVSIAQAAPTASQRESARRLMDEGKELTKAGDKDRALEAYQKAHELMHVPSTGIAVAKAQLALGHLIEAREAALEVIRLPHESGEPPVFERARREAKELDASLKARIPTLKITVKEGPAVRVAVDGGDLARMLVGEPVPLNPGKHSVSAKNADGVERKVDVELAEHDAKQVEIALPAPAPVVVKDDPPPPPPPAAPVMHYERTGAARALIIGGFSLGIVGVAAGGVTGGIALSKSGHVKPQCANGICAPGARDDLDSANSLATISTIAFIAGGVGLAAGIVGLVLPRTTVEPLVQSGLWIGPTSVGLARSF